MTTAAPGTTTDKPPASTHTTCTPGAAVRPTTRVRPRLRPIAALGPCDGVDVEDPYVRRHWVALIGPSAVADLMRLVTAARRGAAVPEPFGLATLLRWDLVRWEAGNLCVLSPIPRVPPQAMRRLAHHTRAKLGA